MSRREKVLAGACAVLVLLVLYLGRDDVTQFKALTIIHCNRWTGSVTHCFDDGCKPIN